jgi:GNAT superfamily N-acetyltransferase
MDSSPRTFAAFTTLPGKIVLFVGAGGRQLLDPSIRTRKVIAIDRDVESLMELKTKVATGMRGSVEVVGSSFEEVTWCGDGVGEALFARVAAVAKTENCFGIMRNVLAWNRGAIEFFRKYGVRFLEDRMSG